eukprot:scaffold7633_cov102-Isochrysis_galbana.AAC.3
MQVARRGTAPAPGTQPNGQSRRVLGCSPPVQRIGTGAGEGRECHARGGQRGTAHHLRQE